MTSFRMNGGALIALATGMTLATITIAQAALAPAPAFLYSTLDIQTVECAVGAHLGPLGACIGERRDHLRDHRDCWTNDRGERVCR